jgi:hypothetical protein
VLVVARIGARRPTARPLDHVEGAITIDATQRVIVIDERAGERESDRDCVAAVIRVESTFPIRDDEVARHRWFE